tara:strand:+ start:1411 stop:1689 length:279 start_codon:yes stop_codon:yes gene_type:complete
MSDPKNEDLSMFSGNGKGIDLDKTDWDKIDYGQARGEDWYAKKFPGFPPDIIAILAQCDGTCPPKAEGKKNTWETRTDLAEELRNRLTIKFD